MTFAKPTFVAFTGVDSRDHILGMKALALHFPIEWGILIDDDRCSQPLYADPDLRSELVRSGGLRFAAHVCGDQARAIANEPNHSELGLEGFQRLQVNHSFEGSSPEQIENVVGFARSKTLRAMLQSQRDFPSDARLDWLFDASFGTGKLADWWPRLPGRHGPFCGYSGGLGPDTVEHALQEIAAPLGSQYFIDMETGVRTEGSFDLGKCEQVCRAVYG